MSTNLKIAIAEPSVIIRSGLENLLKRLPGFRIQMVEIHSVESQTVCYCVLMMNKLTYTIALMRSSTNWNG